MVSQRNTSPAQIKATTSLQLSSETEKHEFADSAATDTVKTEIKNEN